MLPYHLAMSIAISRRGPNLSIHTLHIRTSIVQTLHARGLLHVPIGRLDTQLQSCLGDEISWETGLMDNQAGSSVSKQFLHKRRVFCGCDRRPGAGCMWEHQMLLSDVSSQTHGQSSRRE